MLADAPFDYAVRNGATHILVLNEVPWQPARADASRSALTKYVFHLISAFSEIASALMPVTDVAEFQKRAGGFSEVPSAEDRRRLKQTDERAITAVKTAGLPDETVAALAQADLSHLPSGEPK